MAILIHIMVLCIVKSTLAEDRWVWSRNTPEGRSSGIPGFVPTTTEPPITTFRPSTRSNFGRSSIHHNRLISHPFFFPEGLFNFDFPNSNDDGTTKTRITEDTASLDTSSGAVLTADDKYTTLDRLQEERGPAPVFPRPEPHQLGGLHPEEVFYADDDLLIIKGGGFHSDRFQEPLQPLDAEEHDFSDSGRVPSSVSHPSSDQEYNGNVPVIIPPPREQEDTFSGFRPIRRPSPFSLFVGGPSTNDYMWVPFVSLSASKNDKSGDTYKPISSNHINNNQTRANSKLRRAASNTISYIYPAPAATFAPQQIHRQPSVQHQIVRNPVIQHQTHRQSPVHQQNQRLTQHQTHTQSPVHQQNQRFTQHQTHTQSPVHQQNQAIPTFQPQRFAQHQTLRQPTVHQQNQAMPIVQPQRLAQQSIILPHQSQDVQPLIQHHAIIQVPITIQHQPIFQQPSSHSQVEDFGHSQVEDFGVKPQVSHQEVNQRRPAVSHTIVPQNSVVASHDTGKFEREPLIPHTSVHVSHPAVMNHFTIPNHSSPTASEIEIQPPAFSGVFHSLEGDTDVNFLHPLPQRNPEAEVFQPHTFRRREHNIQQNHRPRL